MFKFVYNLETNIVNYYKAHKNKRPKKLFKKKRFKSTFGLKLSLMSCFNAQQFYITQSQPTRNESEKDNKKVSLVNICLNALISVIDILKKERLDKFKRTGRYVK